jgi:hypothetical protein
MKEIILGKVNRFISVLGFFVALAAAAVIINTKSASAIGTGDISDFTPICLGSANSLTSSLLPLPTTGVL